jgi:hypothetical protein
LRCPFSREWNAHRRRFAIVKNGLSRNPQRGQKGRTSSGVAKRAARSGR